MSTQLSRINVLVADSQELVRKGIIRLLQDENDIRVVAEAGTGEEAIQLSRNYHPDVVVMDVRMPGIGGIEATQRMSQLLPGVQVIGISSVINGAIPTQMLRAGAKAFLTKSVPVAELLAAIRVVSTGQRYVAKDVATQLALNPFRKEESANIFDKLSRREMQISIMLTDGRKVSQISELLGLSPKTVYSYRYRIFEKLGIRSDVELTILAVKQGLSGDSGDAAEAGLNQKAC